MWLLALPVARMLAVGAVCAALVAGLGAAQAGVLAVAAAMAACAHPAPHRRIAAIEDAACLAFLVAMFGLAGAGGFALLALATLAPVHALARDWRPATALIVTAAAGALLAAAAGALVPAVPLRWTSWAALAPAFFLAAPARALLRLAVQARGPEAVAQARLHALGPMLVALVAGAGAGGLAGAAAAWAAMRLATPLVLLMTAERRARLGWLCLGVLAAALPAAAAAALALGYAGGHPAALPAVAVIGLGVFSVGLRVHAPAAMARIVRRAARLASGSRPARSDPSRKYA